MKKQRRTFSSEFKQDAAGLILDQGYSFAEASRAVDVHENTLRSWAKQLELERTGHTPKSKALTAEQQRIQELEVKVNRLEREKAILKKATVDSIKMNAKHGLKRIQTSAIACFRIKGFNYFQQLRPRQQVIHSGSENLFSRLAAFARKLTIGKS